MKIKEFKEVEKSESHPWETTEDQNHPESPDYRPNYMPEAKLKASTQLFANLHRLY